MSPNEESRTDVDTDRLGCLGYSWGAQQGVIRNEMIKETLNWLDKYLGPVKNTPT